MRSTALLAALVAALTLLSPSSALASTDWSWPVRGDVVTKYRNGDDPYAGGQHRGVDVAAPVGAPVVAATSGHVTFAGTAGSSGLTVTLRTSDGRFDLSHLHLSSVEVRKGAPVDRGDQIGAVGTSGRRSIEQPHLHFGVRAAGTDHAYRDPLDFLPPIAPPATQPDPPATAPQPAPVAAPPATATAPAPAAPAAAPSTGIADLPEPSLPAVAAAPGAAPSHDRAPASAQPRHRAAPAGSRSQIAEPRPSGSTSSPRSRTSLVLTGGPVPDVRGADAAVRADRTARITAEAPGSGGVDLGWLAALVGLVAAATCLGRPEGARRAARRGRTAATGLLRPMTGGG